VIDAAREVTGIDFPAVETARRPVTLIFYRSSDRISAI